MDLYISEQLTYIPSDPSAPWGYDSGLRWDLVDDYESVVWTERYNQFSDFKLRATPKWYYENLRKAKYLYSSESNILMMIETISRQIQDDGTYLMDISGRDYTAFLERRNLKTYASSTQEAQLPISYTGTISEIMVWLIYSTCIEPTIAGTNNVIPNLGLSNRVSGGTSLTLQMNRDNVYSMVKELADAMGYGFKIVSKRDHATNSLKLEFVVYRGIDRRNPSLESYYEFSPNRENFFNTQNLQSNKNFINHIRALGHKHAVDVYHPDVPLPVKEDRRTYILDCPDVGSGTGPDATTTTQDRVVLTNRALAAFRQYDFMFINMATGEVPPNVNLFAETSSRNDSISIPGVELYTELGLGDIVIVRDATGAATEMRISEKIWSKEGSETLVTPGFTEYMPVAA